MKSVRGYRGLAASLHASKGLTLVEVLLAMIITSIVAFVIMRVFITTSSGLERSAQEAAAAVQATRFSLLIRYDVAGTQDTFIYGKSYPTNTSKLCTSAETTQAKWNADPAGAGDGGFRRSLFTFEIPTIGYNRSSMPETMSFSPQTDAIEDINGRSYLQWVGYEVRKVVRDKKSSFELWRVLCAPSTTGFDSPTSTMVSSEERLVILGSAVNPDISGLTSLLCYNRAGGLLTVPEATSTNNPNDPISKRCTAFRFLLPYNGGRNALNRIAGNSELGSIVDEWLQRLSTNVERLD